MSYPLICRIVTRSPAKGTRHSTIYHHVTNGHPERSIQPLEDMWRAYLIEFQKKLKRAIII